MSFAWFFVSVIVHTRKALQSHEVPSRHQKQHKSAAKSWSLKQNFFPLQTLLHWVISSKRPFLRYSVGTYPQPHRLGAKDPCPLVAGGCDSVWSSQPWWSGMVPGKVSKHLRAGLRQEAGWEPDPKGEGPKEPKAFQEFRVRSTQIFKSQKSPTPLLPQQAVEQKYSDHMEDTQLPGTPFNHCWLSQDIRQIPLEQSQTVQEEVPRSGLCWALGRFSVAVRHVVIYFSVIYDLTALQLHQLQVSWPKLLHIEKDDGRHHQEHWKQFAKLPIARWSIQIPQQQHLWSLDITALHPKTISTCVCVYDGVFGLCYLMDATGCEANICCLATAAHVV